MYKHSKETKRKISETRKGIKFSKEHRKHISEAMKGRKLTEEHKKNIRNARIGTKLSEETKEKIGLANSGRVFTLEHKKKLSESHKGKKLTKEHKRKIGEAGKGKKRPPRSTEWREKQHNINLGEKSVLWKGGLSKEEDKIRARGKYKEWRKTILERDNYMCQDCGKTNCVLHVHHTKPTRDYPSLRFNPENVITLCASCHSKRHKVLERKILEVL